LNLPIEAHAGSNAQVKETVWRYQLRRHQAEVFHLLNRFNVLLAHRRFGKTVFAVLLLIRVVMETQRNRAQVHYYAPSYAQAKRVAWNYIKEFTAGTGTTYNEAELKANMPNGGIIQLGSADNPDSSRGIYSDYAVLDEPAQMPPRMWTEVLRPALADRKGGALFIGTPQGRHGLFWEMWEQAVGQEDWWRGMYKASETGIVDKAELRAARRVMSKSEYDQEFECSWEASVKGAYWGEAIAKIEAAGQITTVRPEPGKSVYCAFDLGINDATAVWFFQIAGFNEYRFIDYDEFQNVGLTDIVEELRSKPYQYGPWILPHDVEIRSLSTGITRLETMENLGVDVVVAPKKEVIDGIEEARQILSNCWFDREKCRDGLEALRQFCSTFDEKHLVLKLKPLHNWASHGADSFRYFAVTDKAMLLNKWGARLDYSQMDRGNR
jgi:hypothetical protein